ncbi:hypothetical protein [Ruegeria sp. R13_0]|uniref:hypothetical protein n=1 Tax=Ruegeria sp. R13_0 TaxID=2821099 RepID=UPI001FFE0C39|nr:hypothetical protein [Ruegeria sp. R13_0]
MTGPNGQIRIWINTSGLTCYDTSCLEINQTTRIPGNIDVGSGTVTPDEFRQMVITASLAGGIGSGQDRD